MTTVVGESAVPVLRARKKWVGWVVLWGIVAMMQVGLLMRNGALDTFLWRTTRWVMGDQLKYTWQDHKAAHASDVAPAFYDRVDPPLRSTIYKKTEKLWRILRDTGEPYLTGFVVLLIWIYDRRRWKAGWIVTIATINSGVLAWLIRSTAGRWRPINIEGINQWQLWRGFRTGEDLAWPSGHATLAFATAAALTYLSARGKWLFLAVAAGCALARVVMQAHFYSDIVMGSALGWTVGWTTVMVWDRWIKDPATIAA